MKTLLIALSLTIASFSVQAGHNQPDFTVQASGIARQLADQIELNELEYIQVRAYTLEKLELAASIKDMYQANPDMMDSKLHEIEKAYQFRVQNLLSNKQFENYLALNNRYKPELNLIATSAE